MPRHTLNHLIELLEPRDLKTATYTSGSEISDIIDAYSGTVLFGSNGNTQGTPTAEAFAGQTIAGTAYNTWDSNPFNGIDSGGRNVTFSLNADGSHTGSFSVGTANFIGFAVATSQQVHSVTIRGVVTGPGMAFDWSNIQIDFYSGGSKVESHALNDLSADQMDSGSWDPAEAKLVITPDTSNIDGVVVHATARLQASEGCYPDANDLDGQIFVR